MRFTCTSFFLFLLAPAIVQAKPGIEKAPFGKTPDGEEVDAYTLTNAEGMKVKIITYGGIITEIWVPDRDGKLADVVEEFALAVKRSPFTAPVTPAVNAGLACP